MSWCDTCINIDTNLCDKCVNNNIFEDHYEEATYELRVQRREEELKKREEERKKAEDSMCQEYIEVVLSPSFCKTFAKAKLFASKSPYRQKMMVVWARENALIAHNNYILCELYCQVPGPLKNKYITRIENMIEKPRVAIATKNPATNQPLEFPQYEKLFTAKHWIEQPNLRKTDNNKIKIYEPVWLIFGDTEFFIDKKYYSIVLDALEDIDLIGYSNPNQPVIFQSKLGRAVICPLVRI